MRSIGAMGALLLAAGCSSGGEVDSRVENEAHAALVAGNRALETGKFDQAVEHFTQAIALSPQFPQAYLGRARAREQTGRLAEAEADFGKAVETASEDKRAIYHYHLGRHHQRLQQHQKAVEDYGRAMALMETWPNLEYSTAAYMQRGAAYLDLGRWDEAIRDFDFVLARTHDPVRRRELEDLKAQARRKKGAR